MFRHLLVPTDGTEMSQATVERAVRFAKEAGAQITFFHAREGVFSRGDVALYGEGLVLDPALCEQYRQAGAAFADGLLAEARKQAEAAGVSCSVDSVENPVIYEAILEAAGRHGCDLIFLASHGRRGLSGLLLGSETQRVLTHGEIPVLVFPSSDGT